MLEKLDICSCQGCDKNVTLITWPNQTVCTSFKCAPCLLSAGHYTQTIGLIAWTHLED